MIAPNRETGFVHQTVMVAAQQHEIVDLGFTPIRPVLDVMRIQIPAVVTARKRTATIARQQRALDSPRHRPPSPAHSQWFASTVLDHGNQRTIAGQTPY